MEIGEGTPESLPTRELSLKISGKSEASIKHPERNEDALIFNADLGFAAVFDGVGGERGGESASQTAAKVVAERLKERVTDIKEAERLIRGTLISASGTVASEVYPGKTTAVVAKFIETEEGKKIAVVGSVGDSRVYLLRQGRIEQITQDDSTIPQDITNRISNAQKQEDLSEHDLVYFARRNVITASIGQEGPLNPHIYSFEISKGDRLVLATDGVHDNLTDREIEGIINSNPDRSAEALVSSAMVRSGEGQFRSKRDDVTAVVVKLEKNVTLADKTTPEGIKNPLDEIHTLDGLASYYQNIGDEQIEMHNQYNGRPYEMPARMVADMIKAILKGEMTPVSIDNSIIRSKILELLTIKRE